MAYDLGPMLASTIEDHRTEKHLKEDGYILGQPKIDGMRVMFHDGLPKSRSWTTWSSNAFRKFASDHADQIHGWDGEMVAGLFGQARDFRQGSGELRAADGGTEFTFYLFDNFDPSWANHTYEYRFLSCYQDLLGPQDPNNPDDIRRLYPEDAILASQEDFCRRFQGDGYTIDVVLCPTLKLTSMAQIYTQYGYFLNEGREGIILRRPRRGYKYGRSTANEGFLVRIKPFEDFEAVILDSEPAYHNANEAKVSELGYTKRSSHQDNMHPKDYIGAFICFKLGDDPANTFRVGIFKGVSIEERKVWLRHKDRLPTRIIKVSSLGVDGGYDKPRVGTFTGFRHPFDIGEPNG